ncbi:MAG: ribonuclease Z [Nanoarchaeota archaeon]
MIRLVFLGTSSMVPTKERNVSGLYLEYEGEGILFDCGEGTQRQMNIAGINRNRVKKIFISHWHADHIAGILGLIQTIGNKDNEVHLDIYGPKDTRRRMEHLLETSIFDQQLDIDVHEFCLDRNAPDPLVRICDMPRYEVWAAPLEHGMPVLGFRFVEKDRRRMRLKELEKLGIPPGPIYARLQKGHDAEFEGKIIESDKVTTIVKGKRIAIVSDTAFCQSAIALAEESDVLVCESTYAANDEEKAHQYRHMTSQQAAQIASMAGTRKLLLTHFSQRYTQLDDLLADAKAVFPETELANDFKTVRI